MRILRANDAGTVFGRRAGRMAEALEAVAPILDDVRRRGDEALWEWAVRLGDAGAGEPPADWPRVPYDDLQSAEGRLDPDLVRAMDNAATNLRAFAKTQLPQPAQCEPMPGVRLSTIVRPLDVVGAYVPSGRYPLPSTVLMTVVPAQVAGVEQIVLASPQASDAIDGLAHRLGVDDVFRLGGAQAIAAMAFGTESVPRCDRIVGPGNIYVAAAKRLLAGEVGIEFVAGPSEVVIVALEGDPRALAADLLAQAEHDDDASAVLITTSESLAEEVAAEAERQLGDLPTAATARKALDTNGAIVLVGSVAEAMAMVNRYAPEHLCVPSAEYLEGVRHAGSVFVGPYSPEAAGDYAAGTNHVLPTGGVARVRGGLSAADYVKVISVQELSREGLAGLAGTVTTLARSEGLEAHARSVEVRL
ncbi:MAG: histidinol dehydrogenase [Fimbriimonadaceae bacterium]|nr:histidinol dehydrogenase [Fimbriimonadaceae bacterium]